MNRVLTQCEDGALYSTSDSATQGNDGNGMEGDGEHLSLMHQSCVLDVILCILCLRAYPRGCCRISLCRIFVPFFFCATSLALWIVMIRNSILSDFSSSDPVQHVLWVVCMVGHMVSATNVIRAAHNGLAEKYYFLDGSQKSKVELRTDTSMLKWVALICLTVVVLEVIVIVALTSMISTNNDAENWVAAGSFFVLLLLILHPQVMVFGLLEARIQDLLDNVKLCYVLVEKCLDRPCADVDHFYGILADIRKMGASIQIFSWDWQILITSGLATPVSLGLLFSYFTLKYIGDMLSPDGLDPEAGTLLIFFVIAFLFMCVCVIYTMWRLSCVADATSKLHRVLDFTLSRKHVSNGEICAIVKARH